MKRLIYAFIALMITLPCYAQHGGSGAHDSVSAYLKHANTDIIPSKDDTYNMGSSTKEWKDGYFDGTVNVDSITFSDATSQTSAATDFDGSVDTLYVSVLASTNSLISVGTSTMDTTYFTNNVYFQGNSSVFQDDKTLQMGTNPDYQKRLDTNGTGDEFMWEIVYGPSQLADASAIVMKSSYNYSLLNPNNMTDIDNYTNYSELWAANGGADSNDYAGVVIGEGVQTSVAATHYFDFYGVTGSVDGAVDATTEELPPVFRFGIEKDAATHVASGDVLVNGNLEVDSTVYIDGSLVGAGDQFSYMQGGDIINATTGDNLRVLYGWLTPATTEQDLSVSNHDATYDSLTTADRYIKGLAWTLDFGGTEDSLEIADNTDFTFLDAAGANGFTMGGWIEVVANGGTQAIFSKFSELTGVEQREWLFYISGSEQLAVVIYDESANVSCSRVSDAALSDGWHFVSAVYNGAGGATAANGITLYVDGVAVASTASNNGSYSGMEDLPIAVLVGATWNSSGAKASFYEGDMGQIFITTDQLTVNEIWALYTKTRGYYNL